MSGWFVLVDGCPYGFSVPGVTHAQVAALTFPDGEGLDGITIIEGALERPTGPLSERLRPTEGSCDVSPLSVVIHDVDGTLLPLLSRDDDSLTDYERTYLTAPVSKTDTTITVASAAPFSSLPVDAWINGECVRVESATASPLTFNVTRGRYRSRPRAHEVNEDEAILPEVFTVFSGFARRRMVLFRA